MQSFLEFSEEKKIVVKTKMGGEIPATIKVTGKNYHIVKTDSGKQYKVDHQGNSLEEEIELEEAMKGHGFSSSDYMSGAIRHDLSNVKQKSKEVDRDRPTADIDPDWEKEQRQKKMKKEESDKDLPFTPDVKKTKPSTPGKYGSAYSTVRNLARQAMQKQAAKKNVKEEGGKISIGEQALIEKLDKKEELRAALNRHSQHAIEANRRGDDEAVKVHQGYMNKIKDKMAKLVRNEELVGKQHKLDVDKDGKIEGEDLAKLRKMKEEAERPTHYYSTRTAGPRYGRQLVTGVTRHPIEPHHQIDSRGNVTSIRKPSHEGDRGGIINHGSIHKPPTLSDRFIKKEEYQMNLEDYSLDELVDYMMSEDFQRLDELDKKTLASYIKKATRSAIKTHASARDTSRRADDKEGDEAKALRANAKSDMQHSQRRQQSIARAADRLAKEDYDLEEASRTPEERLAIAKRNYEAKLRSAQYPHERMDAKADYDHFHAAMQKEIAARKQRVSEEASKGYAPGWMLKADPELAKKVKEKTQGYKDLKKYAGRDIPKKEELDMKTFSQFMEEIQEIEEAKKDEPSAPNVDAIAKRKAREAAARRREEKAEADKDDLSKDYKPSNAPKSTTKVIAGRAYGGAAQKDDEDETHPVTQKATEKRGRGRPAGSKSGARTAGAAKKSYGGLTFHSLNLPNSNK